MLNASFKSSPNKDTFFSLPYYKVISENKDLTFTPRLYSEKKLMVQNEFREATKNGNLINDLSILSNKNNLDGHIFYQFDKKLNFDNYDTTDVTLKFNRL